MHCFFNGKQIDTCATKTCSIYPCDVKKADNYLTRHGVTRRTADKNKHNILKGILESRIVFNIPDKIIISFKYENGTFFVSLEEKY